MIGNVYNFNTFYKQEALFKLDNEPEHGMLINQVAVLFYQDGEFRSNDNTLISPLSPMDNKPLPDNIFVKDIGIWFGDEIEQDDDDEVEIYTLNGQMYDSAQTNDKLNQKRIHLKWLHVNPVQEEQEDGTKKWVKDLMDSSNLTNVPSAADVKIIANIHWYSDAQYTIDTYRATQASAAAENDKLYEVTEKWKYAPTTLTEEEIQILVQETNWSPKKDYLYQYDESVGRYVLTVTASGEKVLDRVITRNGKVDKTTTVNDELAGAGWIPIDGTWNKFEIEYQPDNSKQYSNVRCIIELGPELYTENEETGEKSKTGLVDPNSMYYEKLESNILTFKNLSWVPDISTHDSATGVTLTIDDKTDGHYPIYNATDGRILSRAERDKLRTIKADMLSSYTGNSLLNGNEIILWQIPKTNTMININGTLTESKMELITPDNKDLYTMSETDIVQAQMQASFNEFLQKRQELAEKYADDQETFEKLTEELNARLEELLNEKHEAISQIVKDYNEAMSEIESMKSQVLQDWDWAMHEWVEAGHSETSFDATQYKTVYDNLIEGIGTLSDNTGQAILEQEELIDQQIKEVYDQLNDIDTASDELKRALSDIYDQINAESQERSEAIAQSALNNYKLSDWFDISNFDFDNYYYLVRFGSNLAGVNPYQGFYINEYYVKSATNNTVFCYIVKNNQTFKGQITFTFAQHGSSGTDYTFSLGLGELVKMPEYNLSAGGNVWVDSTSNEWEVIGPASGALTMGETGFRKIGFNLYDSGNTIINLTNEEKNAIISKWIAGRTKDGYYSGYNSSSSRHDGNANNLQFLARQDQDGNFIEVAVRTNADIDISNYRYIILSAAVRQGATSTYNDNEYDLGPVNFVQMLPLHVRTNDKYVMEGADYITYDDKGTNPQSYSDEYNVTNLEGEQFRIVVDDVNIGQNNLYATTYKWYPHLDENNKLVPCTLYVSDLSTKIAVEAISSNGELLYTMPLLMIKNRYQIPAINSWNGELLIDKDNNRVMAATVAAGHKDNRNRFTGMIMGDVTRKDPSSNRNKLTSGLFGYESGEEAFGFLANGTGFIGKSSTGRIEFDGKDGFIQSANYANSGNGITNKEGTRINLTDGSIDMWGHGYTWTYDDTNKKWNHNTKTGTSSNVHIDTYGSISKPYFRIGVPVEANSGADKNSNGRDVDGLKSLIRIDSSNYYLQTADYGANGKGLRIDLKSGSLDSKGPIKITGNSQSYIDFGDTLTLRGTGTSSIGGWTINSNSLSSNGITIGSGGSIYSGNWGINGDGSAWFKNVTITEGGNTLSSEGFSYYGGTIGGGSVTLADSGYGSTINAADQGVFDTLTVNYLKADTAIINDLTAVKARVTTLEADTVKTRELESIFAYGYRAYFQYVSADAVWINGVDQQSQNTSFQNQIDEVRGGVEHLNEQLGGLAAAIEAIRKLLPGV